MRADTIKDRVDIAAVAQRRIEGLTLRHGSLWGCCPFHEEASPSFKVDSRTQRFKCFGCGASGDAIDLVAQLEGLSFKDAVAALVRELGLDGQELPPIPQRRRRPPAPPKRIPEAELAAFWDRCRRLDEGTGGPDDDPVGVQLALFLARRRFHPMALAELDIAREIPQLGEGPRWWPGSRWPSYRLAVRAFTSSGQLAAIHARAVDETKPKTRWPLARRFGYSCSGLLFADQDGLALLRGRPAPELRVVLVVEGITDLLRLALIVAGDPVFAVLGSASGGFGALAEVDIPQAVTVLAATDSDEAGNRYAQQITTALAPHPVRRLTPEELTHGHR